MSWQDFERLVAECYKRQGYKVTVTSLGGADGGIDLVLHRGRDKVLIQCKHWRTTSVGAPIIREMFGLLTHHGATRVKVVCTGHFTRDAIAFAAGKPIDLVGGGHLLAMVRSVQR